VTPVDVAAELRAIETMPDDLVLDGAGDTLTWGPALDTRLRLGGKYGTDQLRAEVQADLFTGQLAGATWNLGPLDERGRDELGALTGFVPRVAKVGARLPWFDVEAGLATSDWGLGMLANAGDQDPLFGRTDFGDRVLRVRLATAPFGRSLDDRLPIYVVLAGDRVVADELARWDQGDAAWQAVAAVLYTEETDAPSGPVGKELGAYGVYRTQTDAEGLGTHAIAIDGYGFASAPIGGSLVARVAAEAALLDGRTEAAATYGAPDGLAVRSGGIAVRTSLSSADGRATAYARAAWASGDRSADDGVVSDFRFDRDYDVGFVLFDEVVAALDLGAWRQATDPGVAAAPPPGVDTLVAEGAFHQAFALQPAGEVAATRWLDVRAGAVLAWSTAPIAQPFATFRNGGVPTNGAGLPTDGRWLGSELDWGLSTRPEAVAGWRARPSLALQVGHAWPSAALALVGELAL
jgi:hypothetical protein